MPDWSYRTLLGPLLDRVAGERAPQVAVRALAGLAALPLGTRLLEFFGHMSPDPRLAVTVAGRRWATPLGLGCRLDPAGEALAAWDRFGVGFVEVGPVTLVRSESGSGLELRFPGQDSAAGTAGGWEAWCQRLGNRPENAVPVWLRWAAWDPEALAVALPALAAHVAGFVIEGAPAEPEAVQRRRLVQFMESLQRAGARHPVTLGVQVGSVADAEVLSARLKWARALGAAGLWVSLDLQAQGAARDGREAVEAGIREALRLVRLEAGPSALLGVGPVDSPRAALAWRESGADLVRADRGLLDSGPGLPKRIHAALLYAGAQVPAKRQSPVAVSRQSWFWGALLGGSMLAGGLLALVIAMTRVVLPYDEVFCGTTREGLAALNARLLPFMAHDRVTLAGTMISIGVLYLGLSWCGIRRGAHWAKGAVVSSAVVGFLSFFLFLGFGYFDPFHAFVTSVLFQFLLLTLYARGRTRAEPGCPELDDTGAWRRGQWGQLLMILLGVGLMGAGCVICGIGVTRVLVREDLEFLGTTLPGLRSANPRLIPLVAHDRASLGGMLLANGLAVWLAAQWGCAGGARWLWWTFLGAGVPAFAAALGVHVAVGYTDPWHLAPALLAAGMFGVALALLRNWLCDPSRDRLRAWESRTRFPAPAGTPAPRAIHGDGDTLPGAGAAGAASRRG